MNDTPPPDPWQPLEIPSADDTPKWLRYRPYWPLVVPALPRPQLDRLILGVFVIEALYLLTLSALEEGLARLAPALGDAFFMGNTAPGLLLQFASFGALALWTIWVARWLQGRSAHSFIGPARVALRQGTRVFAALLLLFMAVECLPPYWSFDTLEAVRWAWWLPLLPLSLAGLMLQTGAEELLYRGYVQSQIAARMPSAWAWMIIPNILFAIAHWSSGADLVGNIQYVIWAFFFGLAASDLTARTGTLGAAIGFHMANNAYAFLFFGELGAPDSGLALMIFESVNLGADGTGGALPGADWVLSPALTVEVFMTVLMWGVARAALRR